MMVDRRVVLQGGALGLAFVVGGREMVLSPRKARAQDIPLSTLTPAERETLESFGDVLLPGAREAGIAHFVDHQLGVSPGEALLLARLVNVAPPFVNFYRAGLKALDEAATKSHGAPFARLSEDTKIAFVDQIRQRPPDGWVGPPSPFFYYVVRNDAVDVVYGTVEGFEKLGIPYMPHIPPSAKW
ncbi:gluconate 2-dehydrogenase subunit 3 family protein [Bradyrhizobium manausense]|uniref:gluconate 2-dehydrogenase subunit 3 family protein n=1 Tax=Bradyrhizobium manausense TaxID=989370 RepID=UPI001BAC4FB2|nr:gluconate 2-dehydrogenase subunit 3 family protein [Bradyrhizobium manausense]MBR0725494.1 gluconate 2-dehydrogenase subunit 3 family protein [Bradyrhizobium manausense]MBR0834178.1 gluconate 2-dehydrogenase subunit 3 family protein [Bradyrhizobium manausense]